MYSKALVIATLTAYAAAHSGIPMVKGDVGGAMTGLGIDPNVPVSDPNKNVIEKDANTMPSRTNANANGLGTLNGKTKVTLDMAQKAIDLGGAGQMPQVAKTMDITYRQMVVDGRFDPARGAVVLIDPTATGNFANAVEAKVVSAPPVVKQANIKGTTVVGQDMAMKVEIPDSVTCTGPNGACLMRITNGRNEGNQLWGGHVLFQKVPATGAAAAPPANGATGAAPATPAVPATNAAAHNNKRQHAREFTA
jgi:hypothetical protein